LTIEGKLRSRLIGVEGETVGADTGELDEAFDNGGVPTPILTGNEPPRVET
jgi:hypothetical protein